MKCWWNDEGLMWARSASDSMAIGCAKCCAHPRHGLGDALDARLRQANLGDAAADRTSQETNENLVDDERGEQLRVGGFRHQLDEARRRVDDRRRRLAHEQATAAPCARHAVRVDPQCQLSDLVRIEVELERQERLALARPDDLTGDGQIDGVRDHARRVVGVDLAPEHDDLRALRHDAEGRRDRRPHHLGVGLGASDHVETGHAERERPVVRRVRSKQPRQAEQALGVGSVIGSRLRRTRRPRQPAAIPLGWIG